MDLFARIADHLRLLELETPRLTSTGKQIIQEDKPPKDNERDLSIQGVASGQGQQDLARNRQIPFMVQIIIKNTNQSQAFNDAWKIADSFDKLPRKENGEWVTLRSSDGSFLFDSSEVYTQPRNLGIQEHDAYLYVLTVRLNISK